MNTTPEPHRRVRANHLRAAVAHALERAGVPAVVATVEAEVMVEADLCGVPSHGVLMLPRLLAGLRDQRATAAPQVRLIRDRGATCVFDADHGPGRWAAAMAMDHALERARTHGLGACLSVRTTHWGRAHAYAARAAHAGFVGLCTTNATPTLTPPGATRALLGNNPLAIGVPRAHGAAPIVLDMAMTQAAFGKVATWLREGRDIPGDWGLDHEGRPTTDPAVVLASGLLAPMGGHKGAGLAFMIELLTAGFAGAEFGHETAVRDASGLDPGTTKLFLAIDPDVWGLGGGLTARVEGLAQWMREGTGGGLLPGERSWRTRARYLRDGIPLHPAIVDALAADGVTLDLDLDLGLDVDVDVDVRDATRQSPGS